MPLDPDGNYYADLPDGPSGTGTGTLRTIGGGAGAPGGSTPVTTIYVDTSTGAIYSYVSGSWVVQTGSSAGGGQIVTYTSGTPANPANLSQPALAYDPNGILSTLGWNTSTHLWA